MKNKKINTMCVHGAYKANSGEPQVFPIVQNTTYRYYDGEDVAALFNLESDKFMYSRLDNPTVRNLEEKIALLEGGSACLCTSSGQSATLITILNLANAGDNIIATNNVYGGTFNLFNVTLRKLGIDIRFISSSTEVSEIEKLIDDNTKMIFSETLSNPRVEVLDFEKYKNIANKFNIPFVVDNTLATPYICRPIEFGADIVLHSTTKYMDGHGTTVGGAIIESGKFNWKDNNRFKEFSEPDSSYHGVKFIDFKEKAFCTKARAQLLRDLGSTMSPMNAFLVTKGLETLHLRMERHSSNALKLANFLNENKNVDWILYPSIKDSILSSKYLKNGFGGVLTFGIKGGRKKAEKFIKNLELTSLVVHVGDIRTSVLHPASSTHRQLSEEEQKNAGISPELIRVSVGIEDIDDILDDFKLGLKI